MTNKTENFIQRLRGITLSDNKKLAMRERLSAYLELHPVLAPEPATGPLSAFYVFASSRRFTVYAASFFILVIAGGSITLAAEGTTPGDTLYAVKVNVTEPLMTILAADDASQARVAAKIATRRADEAVQLATRGALTPERQAYLSEHIQESVNKAVDKANTLARNGNPEGADTVRANLAAGLAGEAQALGAIATTQEDGDRTRAEGLLAIVSASTDKLDESAGTNLGLSSEGEDAIAKHGVAVLLRASKHGAAATTTATSTSGTFTASRARGSIRITASTTFTTLREEHAFGGVELMAPKVDSALPNLLQKNDDAQSADPGAAIEGAARE